jgi:hypothetical protein
MDTPDAAIALAGSYDLDSFLHTPDKNNTIFLPCIPMMSANRRLHFFRRCFFFLINKKNESMVNCQYKFHQS